MIMKTLIKVATVAILFLCIQGCAWTTSISKDEMTGKKRAYAHSDTTTPTRQMGFPYANVTARLTVGCNDKSEWAYFNFTETPDLLDTSTEDGYDTFDSRIKWDDLVSNVKMMQTWGASSIHFWDYKSAISKIAESNTVLLELNWYGEGRAYFKFSLSGSSSALAKIRRACKGR